MLTGAKFNATLLSAATALCLVLTSGIGDARAAGAETDTAGMIRLADASGHRQREHRPQPPRGSHSRHTETQRTDNGHTSHTTWEGANGKTATRDATVVNDRENGTRTRDVSYTGPNGNERTVENVTQKTDTGYTRDTTYTNAKGQTATRDAVVTNDPAAGTRTRDVTYTGVNGKTSTVDSTTTRTDNGYVRDTVVTGPNGQTGTRSTTVECDKTAGKCTKDVEVNGGSDAGHN